MLHSIRSFSKSGGPIYAECGGLMYLSQFLRVPTKESSTDTIPHSSCQHVDHAMCGVFPFGTSMTSKLKMAYLSALTTTGCAIFPSNSTVMGHEFHYSAIVPMTGEENEEPKQGSPFMVSPCGMPGQSIEAVPFGFQVLNTCGSYMHQCWRSNSAFAAAFVGACTKYQQQQTKSKSTL